MSFSIIKKLMRNIMSMTMQPLSALLVPLILLLLFLYVNRHNRKRHVIPPSPPKLPIIGNIHQLSSSNPHHSLRSLSNRYGDVMLLHLGNVPTLVVSSAAAAREIMVTHDSIFSNRPMTKKAKKFFYDFKDIGTAPYGEYWRQMKGICVQNLLNHKMVQSFGTQREEEINIILQNIKKSISNPINLSELFKDFTNDMICRVVFGRKYCENQSGINFNKFMKEFTELLAEFCFGDYFNWLAWIDRLRGWDKKVDKIVEQFDDFIEMVIKDHVNDGGNDRRKDFLDVLLHVQKDDTIGVTFDNVGVKAIIMNMFAAGTDTTSALLEWAMAELLKHPQIMKKLQKEIRQITADKMHIQEQNLQQMNYLKAVIKETIRLHPTVPLLAPRESTQDTEINGYHIPAKTSVLINAWAIHRDPSAWNDPEMFDPERFLHSPIDYQGDDLQLIPFGAGRRICPGILFAMANTELLLANLVRNFDWRLPEGVGTQNLDMTECFTVSMHKNTPLIACAIPYP